MALAADASRIAALPPDRQSAMEPQRFAVGGLSQSAMAPWYTRREATMSTPGTGRGLLAGATSGRADAVKTTAPAGSYVIPADVVSGMGKGNTEFGARVMQSVLSSGPMGTSMPSAGRGHLGMPKAPKIAKGGQVQGSGPAENRDVLFSHGEYVVDPQTVAAMGDGDPIRGKKVLDHLMQVLRQQIIKEMQELPAPVGAKPLKGSKK